MIRETVLRDFSNWDAEKQLSEYQSYKKLGDYSPFGDDDYALMEMVMNNPNAEISVECENGVCDIISETPDYGDGNRDFNDYRLGKTLVSIDKFNDVVNSIDYKKHYNEFYAIAENKLDNNNIYLFVDVDGEWLLIGEATFNDYKIKNKGGYIKQVDSINIHDKYRGKGLSTLLYRRLKAKNRWTIVSGNKQFDGARKIWTSLSKKDGIKLYDEKTGILSSDYIEIDNSENRNIWNGSNSNKLFVLEGLLDLDDKPFKATILENFSTWDREKQINELESYKKLGESGHIIFNEDEISLMEDIMNNTNDEVSVECEDGVCEIVSGETDNRLDENANATFKDDDLDKIKLLFDTFLKGKKDDDSSDDYIFNLSKTLKLKGVGEDLVFDPLVDFGNNIIKLKKFLINTYGNRVKFDNPQMKTLLMNKMDDDSITAEDMSKIPFFLILANAAVGADFKSIFGKAQAGNEFREKFKRINSKVTRFYTSAKTYAQALIIKSQPGSEELVDIYKKEKDELINKIRDEEEKDEPNETLLLKLKQELENFDQKKDEDIIKLQQKSDKELHIPVDERRVVLWEKMFGNKPNPQMLKIIDDGLMGLKPENNIINAIKNGWDKLVEIENKLTTDGHGTFPNLRMKLYNLKLSGEGKGERLIQFLFPKAEVSGGSLSYDIMLDSQKYEVKAYPQGTDIKLGKEARATNFAKLNDLQMLIENLSMIFSDNKNKEILTAQIEGLDNGVELFNKLKQSLMMPIPGSANTLINAFATGEISRTAIETMKDALLNFSTLVEKIEQNKFYYMKIFKKSDNTIYKVIDGPNPTGKNVSFKAKALANPQEEEKVVKTLLKILDNKIFIENPDTYVEKAFAEIEEHINSSFEKHPMILLNDDKGRNEDSGDSKIITNITYVDDVIKKFKVVTITRGHAAVLPNNK